MIGVLKFLTHIFFFLLLVIYIFTVMGDAVQTVAHNQDVSNLIMWGIGIAIVLVWGGIISFLDWAKRKMSV